MFRYLLSCISSVIVVTFIFTSSIANSAQPILTIYSYSSFASKWGPGQAVIDEFEAECQCKVNLIALSDGVTILNRLRLEGSASKADIVLGLDNNLLAIAKQTGLIQPHHIQPFANRNIDWWNDYFVPYDYGHFAFIYNKDLIQEPPKSFAELLDNKNNWKIVYQDPRTSTVGQGLLLWIKKIYGESAEQAWQQITSKTLTVTKSWSESYGLFLRNEADFVVSYDVSPIAHIINDDDYRYKAAIFEEGHYLQIETAGITTSSDQFELAQQFLTFLGQSKIQHILATKNIMFPIVKIDLPDAFNQLEPVTKVLEFTSEEVAQHNKEWIEEWQNTVSR